METKKFNFFILILFLILNITIQSQSNTVLKLHKNANNNALVSISDENGKTIVPLTQLTPNTSINLPDHGSKRIYLNEVRFMGQSAVNVEPTKGLPIKKGKTNYLCNNCKGRGLTQKPFEGQNISIDAE